MWYVPQSYGGLKGGQRFFIQQWGVETGGKSPLVSLILRTSIKELLREIIDTATMVEMGEMKSRSLAGLAEELIYLVRTNRLLRSSFPDDVDLLGGIVERHNNSNDLDHWKTVRIAASSFLKKLDAVDLPRIYHKELKAMLQSGETSFQAIRNGIRSLVSELMAKGYSARYLHQWGYGVFILDTEPDFMARYDRIHSDLGSKDERPFDTVLKFRRPATAELPLDPFEQTDVSILADVTVPDGGHHEACRQFFQDGLSYVRVNLSAMDRFAAAEKAHKMLGDRLALWRLTNPNYRPGISHDVLVLEGSASEAASWWGLSLSSFVHSRIPTAMHPASIKLS